ncbi:MAG: TonB-dependent receptor plug domain-containing protein, partial [Thermoanaerobaculia bacterium]
MLVFFAATYSGVVSGQTTDAPAKKDNNATETKAEETKPQVVPPVEEKVTVTASRFERLIDLTPQSVTVIDSKTISSRPLWNVHSILAEVPGVSYQRSGGLDGQLVVRGLSSNDSRVVMFVDGDRYRTGRPSLEYSFLDPNEFERIEVVRGPASAIYGADAMNGVVNAITRRAEGDVTQQPFSLTPRLYALGFSSANHLGAGRLELQGLGDGYDLLIGANYRTAGNYRSGDGEIPNSDFDSRSVNIRAGYSPSAMRHFDFIGKVAFEDSGKASAPGAPLVTTRMVPLKEGSIRLGYTQNQVTNWLQDLEGDVYVRDEHTFIQSVTATAANGNVEHRDTWVIGPTELGGKLLARSVLHNSVLAYGVDIYDEQVPPFEDEVTVLNAAGAQVSFSPRAPRVRSARQSNIGAFGHYDWDPSSQWTVSLGSRYDYTRTETGSKP